MRETIAGVVRAGLAGTLIMAAPVQAQDWSSTPWHVKCVDPGDCTPADEVYRTMLEHASGWLSSLGFATPSLATDSAHPGAYVAEVNDSRITVTDPGTSEQVEYVGIYFSGARQLVLRSDQYFTVGEPGQTEADPEYQHELAFQFTPVHELFHAVQNTHLRMDQYASQQDKQDVDWIIEGTATSVQVEYGRAFSSETGARREARSFATPLHQPAADETRGTWPFWSGVGEQIGSPSRVAWFRDVIEPGRLTASNALDRVDDALADHGGLFRQLPRFFATLPPVRVEAVPYRAEADRVPEIFRVPVSVREVAGKGVTLDVVAPGGDDVTVLFSLESPQSAGPLSQDLHLIIEREVRPQRFARFSMPGGSTKTFNVVVANVAPRASNSKARDAILRVTLMRGQCSFTANVTGDAGGAYAGDVAYYNALEAGQGVEKGMAAGTGADAGMHDQLQGMMGMMGGFAKMAEQMGLEVDEEAKAKLEAFDNQKSQAVKETEDFEQEILHSGSDNFGLTLQTRAGGTVGALATLLGGGFNLGASGEYNIPQGPGLEGAVDFEPSMVYATAGVTDADYESVKFIWEPGEPGFAVVTLNKPTEAPVIHGTLTAELHAEHVYDGGRPKINVEASFIASEGFLSCMN